MASCSREDLNRDRVYYCNSEVDRERFRVKIGSNGIFYKHGSEPSGNGTGDSSCVLGKLGSLSCDSCDSLHNFVEGMDCRQSGHRHSACPSPVDRGTSTSTGARSADGGGGRSGSGSVLSVEGDNSSAVSVSCGSGGTNKVHLSDAERDKDSLVSASNSASASYGFCTLWEELSTSQDHTEEEEGGGWIFVVKNNQIYAHQKITKSQPRCVPTKLFLLS
jgi:hypothetical protein